MAKKKRRKMGKDSYTESYKSRDEGSSMRKGIFDFKKAGYSEVKYYKPSEGANKIVIVPYEIQSKNHPKVKAGKAEIGDLDYLLDIYVHKYVGASEADIVCPKQTYGKPCPICDIQRSMYSAAKSEEDKKAAGKLRAKRRVAYNVLEVKKGEVQDELKLFEVSHFLFEKEMIEEAVDCGDGDDIVAFADPEDGAIVKFRVTIEKSKEFGESPRYKSFSFGDREEEIEDDVIDKAISFDKALVVLSPDEIMALYEGDDDDDDDDDEEEEKPKKSKSKKSKKKVEEPEDDDDEDEDEPEEEEEEEEEEEVEEKPKKSKAKSKAKSKKKKEPEPEEDEDEDEPEEDDEDEEEEKPKKSSKSKGKSKEKPEKSKSSKKKKSSDDECPEGHEFGTDCDEKKECNRCELWEACSEAQENM